jgi:AcrR family transcriptional regulator
LDPQVAGLANPRKVGRRPRIDRAMIARAASEIGLDRVTMKAVADLLGVSVAGLYHHVEGRDELMRLGGEYSAAQIPVPVDQGQHWTAWLLEWAHFVHGAFVAQPPLLGQFLTGSIGIERMATQMEAVLSVLTRQGFSAVDAIQAYGLVNDCALGAAVSEIRQIEARRTGRQLSAEYHQILADQASDAFPNLRKIGDDTKLMTRDVSERILTVLIGIAVRRGEPWKPILDLADTSSEPERSIDMLHP